MTGLREALAGGRPAPAKKIVADGEGATKLVTVQVAGAPSSAAARRIAFGVANSPLVKTTFFAQDCNWGRIMAAIGASGVDVDPEAINIRIGEVPVVSGGVGLGFGGGEAAPQALAPGRVVGGVDVQLGGG